jgi:F-type H+-transporting ATPase subunit b
VIEINWTIGLQFLNFLVLMLLLNVLLFRPLRGVLEKRKATVDGGHARARELKEQIDEKMARYQDQLQQAKLKGNEEKAALRSAAAKEEAEILGAAREVASGRLQAIREQVQTEAAQAGKELRTQTSALAAQVASKVLGRGV